MFGGKLRMLKFKVKDSKNYRFHYLEGSLAEKEIDLIIEEQEQVIKELQEFFNIKVPFKIQYYLLDNAKQVGKYYGDNGEYNGFARYPDKIYAVYNKKVKCIGYHEDTHIVSDLFYDQNSTFITEGIAMYFDKTWWGKENEYWVDQFLKDGSYINITKLLYDEEVILKAEIAYPITGAFTKFLIDKFGKDKYITLYKNNSINDSTFVNIYNKSLAKLETDFLNYIKTFILNKMN